MLARIGHPFEEIDIDSDDDLLRRYLERIPVLTLDGKDLYDFYIDEADLRARVGSAAHEHRRGATD